MCGQNVEFVNVKLVVNTVTTVLERVKQTSIFTILFRFFFCSFSMLSVAIALPNPRNKTLLQKALNSTLSMEPRISKPATDPCPITEE